MDSYRSVAVAAAPIFRPYLLCGLILLWALAITCCTRRSGDDELKFQWSDGKAVALIIPETLYGSSQTGWSVHLVKAVEQPAMLGSFRLSDGDLLFEPLVPFTRGLEYEVKYNGQPLARIVVPPSENKPELMAVYPTQDTVPENLLKIYLSFTRPMQTGNSLKHVTLTSEGGDTLRDIFLDLQPELWNDDNTLLTVWLDPGRGKRGLQPNKKLGAPLEKGKRYTLTISPDWSDIHGAALRAAQIKGFCVGDRDEVSPATRRWRVAVPHQSTNDPLIVRFAEPLDYALILSALRIADKSGSTVRGNWTAGDEEKTAMFIPDTLWAKGFYTLDVEPRLEDLAGNNLSRLFDEDLHVDGSSAEIIASISFEVR